MVKYKIKLLSSSSGPVHIQSYLSKLRLLHNIRGQILKVSLYLTAEFPQAPCWSVRMLIIFWISWIAVTWSRYLAALIKWSHIFSSSRLSAEYCAQSDLNRKKETSINPIKTMEKSFKMHHEIIFNMNWTNQTFSYFYIPHWLN